MSNFAATKLTSNDALLHRVMNDVQRCNRYVPKAFGEYLNFDIDWGSGTAYFEIFDCRTGKKKRDCPLGNVYNSMDLVAFRLYTLHI